MAKLCHSYFYVCLNMTWIFCSCICTPKSFQLFQTTHLWYFKYSLSTFCDCSWFLPLDRSCRRRGTVWLSSWTRTAGVWLSWRRRRRAQTRASNAHRDYSTTSRVKQMGKWQRTFWVLSPQSAHLMSVLLNMLIVHFPFWFPAKSEGQAEELKRLQCKLEQQTQASAQELLHMKKTLSDAENKNDRSTLFSLLQLNTQCALLNCFWL